MISSLRNQTSIKILFLLLLFLSSCSTHSTPVIITAYPTKNKAVLQAPSPHPTKILTVAVTKTPSQPQPEPIITTIPPSETPAWLPPLDIHTQISTLPDSQYLIYWSYSDPFCGLKGVSTSGKVYELINFSCYGFSSTGHYVFDSAAYQDIVISNNALYLILPHGKNLYLYHLKDHQQELLNPSQREDCIINSISWDGTKFAGLCGGPQYDQPDQLAIRTKDSDWTIIKKPFPPDVKKYDGYKAFWSPDGKKLAFVASPYPQEYMVYVINDIDQCLRDQLSCHTQVTGPYWENITDYITWSPSGDEFAVTISHAIEVYNINTIEFNTLVNYSNGLWLHGAAWSPDGKWIGYSCDQELDSSVDVNGYLISTEDGTTLLLTRKDVHQVIGWLNIEPN